MGTPVVKAKVIFNYTADGIVQPAASQEVKHYAPGSAKSALTKQIGTGISPGAYAISKNIPVMYIYQPAPGIAYDGLRDEIQITDEYYDDTTLVIQGGTIKIQIGTGPKFDVNYSLTNKILSIPVAGTSLETYTPSAGNLYILFNVQAALPQESSVLGYASSITFTTVEGNDYAAGTVQTDSVTGAAKIVAGAVVVILACVKERSYIFDGDDIDYTIVIEHVAQASEAVILQGEVILVPPTGVTLISIIGDAVHFEIDYANNWLFAKQQILLNDSTEQNRYEVTVHCNYHPITT